MPRVANPPAGKPRAGGRQMLVSPRKDSSVKMTISDDRSEKAARLQSRKALQEIEMNTMKASASPMRKQARTSQMNGNESPGTPRTQQAHSRSRNSLNIVSQNAGTPVKRVPILANFEEWMKMATDNKINPANSWNFALIDYFHDMSLLKEKNGGVNFQKASCTLDGCVKIYTSRVDSVAESTGRLLSGLADSGESDKRKRRRGEDGEGDDGEGEEEDEDEEDEDGNKKKKKKEKIRNHESTLAKDFLSLQLKKLELEFAVDPLFKKASADFDEGGAKGLLLNHLCIDGQGRIVFDSSDDAGDGLQHDETTQPNQPESDEQDEDPAGEQIKSDETAADKGIDLDSLAARFFPDLSLLDHQDICPSMKGFTLGDPNGDLNIPLLKAPSDWISPLKTNPAPPPNLNIDLADQTGIFLNDMNAAGFDDDDDTGRPLSDFDLPENIRFGEGGEAWARDAALEPLLNVVRADDNSDDLVPDPISVDGYAVALHHGYREDAQHEQILEYFSNAMQAQKGPKGKNLWMGGEYWRIDRIRKANATQNETTKPAVRRERKEKEPFEIDFMGPMDPALQELLDAPPATNASITLPKAQWRTKGRNLLEVEDEPLDPRLLLRLWLKPKARLGGVSRRKHSNNAVTQLFEGRQDDLPQPQDGDGDDGERREGDYDANFFADDDEGLPFDIPLPIDDDDDDENENGLFQDAREMLSPPPGMDGNKSPAPDAHPQSSQFPPSQSDILPGSFGSQLVTAGGRRLRPEYVNYARTAKKVDVRRLKESMWKGMAENITFTVPEIVDPTPAVVTDRDGDVDMDAMDVDPPPVPPETPKEAAPGASLKFTEMINSLGAVYPSEQMKDISTSYCFICLLHLANEKGLVLEGGDERMGMNEIMVRKDETVGEGYVGE